MPKLKNSYTTFWVNFQTLWKCELISNVFNFTDTGVGKLTVGKLYGGILIHENWRNTKFNCIEELRKQEAEMEALEKAEALAAAELAAKEVADRGSSYEAEQEAEERKKELEQGELNDNYMNEEDFFDAGRQHPM